MTYLEVLCIISIEPRRYSFPGGDPYGPTLPCLHPAGVLCPSRLRLPPPRHPQEKDAVAQELQDHLADHADALVEAGWDPEEAQAHALDAMGEAKEVGGRWTGNFPRWLVLSRLSLAALVLAITVALPFLFPAVAGAAGSLQARWDPAAHAAAHFEEPPPLVPMDVQWEIYDGTILSSTEGGGSAPGRALFRRSLHCSLP